jgi:nucleoside-diphosphate-sugar epimerase
MGIKKKNIWILGGTGFIGTALVKNLSSNPENLLHLLVHKNFPYKFLEPFNLFTGSIEDFDLSWMVKYPPEIIFHLARIGGSNYFTRSFASMRGAKANRRLISFLYNLKSPPVVVYVSGSLMYGHQSEGKFADENSELSPVSYARHYIRGEQPWLETQEKKELDVRFARPGWIVGSSSWFKIFYWNYYLKTGKIPMYGNGAQLMSLIDIDDCAGQIVNLAENGSKNQNLNIFSSNPVTQQFFAEIVARFLNTGIEIITENKTEKIYGRTVSEAFISSIPLKSNFPDVFGHYKNKYPNAEEIINKTISALKHI